MILPTILKIAWATLGFLGLAIVVVLSIGWYASEELIHPPHDPQVDPAPFALPLEGVSFESRDGLRLAGWFIRGTNGAMVILAHGRGSDHTHMLPEAKFLYESGFSVFLFDFRYRGESEGDAQTLGVKEAWDIQSAVDYLKERPDVDAERIGVQGGSLGAASAILAAAEKPEIKGVVAQIPFTSINSIFCHTFEQLFGLPCIPFAPVTKWISELRLGVDLDKVAPVEVIGKISPRPILLIDEGKDALFPSDSVETLYEAAGEPKMFWSVPEAEHGQARQTDPEEFERRVVAFWQQSFQIPQL